jgi:hypothetical protein
LQICLQFSEVVALIKIYFALFVAIAIAVTLLDFIRERETDKPLLDLFESDAGIFTPRPIAFNSRDRAVQELLGS